MYGRFSASFFCAWFRPVLCAWAELLWIPCIITLFRCVQCQLRDKNATVLQADTLDYKLMCIRTKVRAVEQSLPWLSVYVCLLSVGSLNCTAVTVLGRVNRASAPSTVYITGCLILLQILEICWKFAKSLGNCLTVFDCLWLQLHVKVVQHLWKRSDSKPGSVCSHYPVYMS